MKSPAEGEFSKDFLCGAGAIAEFIFGDRAYRRRVFYLAQKGRLPFFRLRTQICARKSTLLDWIKEQEKRHNKNKNDKDDKEVKINEDGEE